MTCAETIYEKLKAADSLPSPEGVALEILRMMESDDASIGELTRLIERDPALSARLLCTANSPTRGTAVRITSAHQAATLLGLQTVSSIALAFSVLSENRSGTCEGFDYDFVWSASLARASAMRRLARFADTISSDEAFTYGLLSLIGRLGLASVSPEDYARVLAEVEVSGPCELVAEHERAIFGIDGEHLTAMMTRDWGMRRLYELVRQREAADGELSRKPHEMFVLLELASLLARIFVEATANAEQLAQLEALATELGIDAEQFATLFDDAVADWRSDGRELSIVTRAVPDFAELMRTAAARHRP